jgi:hypothetical protein
VTTTVSWKVLYKNTKGGFTDAMIESIDVEENGLFFQL